VNAKLKLCSPFRLLTAATSPGNTGGRSSYFPALLTIPTVPKDCDSNRPTGCVRNCPTEP
ncbi:MAG: hypothetical protein IKP71_05915, partial [Candidatus Riflebacteria bacterium]|nr:hypothetical protein [Candidatus Riflebacteria bacterium]